MTEALMIFEEQNDKFGSSPMLLNNMALIKMQMGKFSEAEECLQEAIIEQTKDPEVYINMITCIEQIGGNKKAVADMLRLVFEFINGKCKPSSGKFNNSTPIILS